MSATPTIPKSAFANIDARLRCPTPDCWGDLLLIPTGMVSALNGTIDDGYNGMLGWFWVACAVTTIGLVVVTRLALREKYYSAVMAATGLLYLAILTAFGTDLVARAILSSA